MYITSISNPRKVNSVLRLSKSKLFQLKTRKLVNLIQYLRWNTIKKHWKQKINRIYRKIHYLFSGKRVNLFLIIEKSAASWTKYAKSRIYIINSAIVGIKLRALKWSC